MIQSDDTPPLPTDLTYEAYRAVQSTSADEPAIWDITVKLLSEVLEIGPMPDIYTNEGFKLDVIGWLMEMAMATKALRFELDSGSHNLKDRHAKITDEIKKLRAGMPSLIHSPPPR